VPVVFESSGELEPRRPVLEGPSWTTVESGPVALLEAFHTAVRAHVRGGRLPWAGGLAEAMDGQGVRAGR